MRARPSSRSRPEADLVDVELVDVGHLVELESAVLDDPAGPDDVDPPRDRRRVRRRRLVGAVVAVGVVAGAVVANVVELRADQARRAAIAALPGILPSLDEPLVPRWEQDGWLTAQAADIGLLQGDDGSTRAVDLATGEVRWTRAADDGAGCWTFPPDASLEESRFGCLAYPGADGDPTGFDARLEFRVLEVATGAEVGALVLQGQHVGLDLVDGDVVLVVALGDGRVRAVRWSPASDAAVWDVTSREPVFPAGRTDLLTWGSRLGEAFVLTTASSQVAFSLDTGAEVSVEPVEATTWVETLDLPDGGTAIWEHQDRDGGTGTVVDPDGSVRFHLPGPVRTPLLDDGSVPDVLIAEDLSGSRLWGLDAATGEDLWTLEVPQTWPLLVLDGRMLLVGGTGARMIELRDGSEVWSADGAAELGQAPFGQAPMTDGELVLLLERDGGAPVLAARRLSDGSVVWRAPVPPTTSWASSTGSGRVLLHTGSSVIGLG